MKFSESWLREWVNLPIDGKKLVDQLTMIGLEVDRVESAAPPFSGVIVGQIVSVEPHPNAEKLRVCQVDSGGEAPLQLVCGAANARVGLRAPLAIEGAVLPGDITIRKTDLRGIDSYGMLCSQKELGLSDSADGLMALPENVVPGTNLRTALDLDDSLIEIDLTPNRGDCLSICGIARDIGARNRIAYTPVTVDEVAADIDDRFPIRIDDPDHSTRYAGRIIRGIDPRATTPYWMVERLRRSGIRAVSPVVDVTNYVMLEFGQPMHAFDLAQLSHGIEVRPAAKGERLKLLDGREIALSEDTLVIADGSGAVALAGIMGGDTTAVGENTRDIFLESAFFSPRWIAGRPRRYGLNTDSAHRFERGVDPVLQVRAMERATGLLLGMVGGEPGPVSLVLDDSGVETAPAITLRQSRIRRVLGTAIAPHEANEILTRLGMEVVPQTDAWLVTPPSYRFDIRIESDLIEELARIHGYNSLPRTHPVFQPRIQGTPGTVLDLHGLRGVLVERGYEEAITYSFVDAELQRMLEPRQEALALENPISADMSVMRTSLWPGLVRTLQQNLNRQQTRVRLFESGLRFLPQNGQLEQKSTLAGLVSGAQYPEQWGVATRPADFFDAKGDLEALLICAAGPFLFEKASHPGLHPGQTARVVGPLGAVGWLGVLHPTLERALGLSQSAVLFELELDALEASPLQRFKALSRFPSIRRDIAILVDSEISVQRVLDCIYEAAPPYLTNVTLFDVYTGEGVVSGRKSLALGLILQELSRTLTEADIEGSVAEVLRHLKQSLGATLRE